MKKNIIILERRLFSIFGHERTQIETINEYFKNNSTYVISCKNTPVAELNLKNKFYLDMPQFLIKEEGKESKNYIRKSAENLEIILKKTKFKLNTNLLIPSARTAEISMLTILFCENKTNVVVLVLFRNYCSEHQTNSKAT